jgi:heptosyltransferase-3
MSRLAMRILFIKPKYIGDSLLLTPTIMAVKRAYPEAEIWVLVRRGCEAILNGCPAIHCVLGLTPVKDCRREKFSWFLDLLVLRELRKVVFDHVFELGDGHRGRWFVLGTRWRKSYSVAPAGPFNWFWQKRFSGISNFKWHDCHRVEKDFMSVNDFLPIPQPIPGLCFDQERTVPWVPAETLDSFAIMHIGTRQPQKQWALPEWIKVGKFVLQHLPHIVISCGPEVNEIAEAHLLQKGLGDRALCTMGKTNWNELAGLLHRARLFVGLDTAAMHLAAACHCPTVALFGPTDEIHWHPWQVPCQIVTKNGCNLTGPDHLILANQRSMLDIKAADVITACESLLSQPDRPDRAETLAGAM